MWIRLKADVKLNGKPFSSGDTVNVPGPMAAHLCGAEQAEPADMPRARQVKAESQPEVFAEAQQETATVVGARRKRRAKKQ